MISHPPPNLLPKDHQLVECLLQGYNNEEISQELNLAKRTVKARLARLFAKFGITGGIKRIKLATLLYNKDTESSGPVRVRMPMRIKNVCVYVAQGYKNGEIAALLGTTEHVIKNYLRIAYDITGQSSRLELTLWWETYGKAVKIRGDCSLNWEFYS